MKANEVIRLIDAGFTAAEIRAMQEPAPAPTPASAPAPTPAPAPAPAPTPAPTPAPAQDGVESKLTELIDLIKAGNLRAGAAMPTQSDPFTRVINPYTGKEVG